MKWNTDPVWKNLLPFLRETIRLQKLLTDGADFLLTVTDKKSVKSKSIAKIAYSHLEKSMIQAPGGEKRCQDMQLGNN